MTYGRRYEAKMPQAAAERQLREPEEHFADGRQALKELRAKAAAQQQARPSCASRAGALHRLAAERAGVATITPVPRPVRTVRRDGREPMGLGAAIGALVTERA